MADKPGASACVEAILPILTVMFALPALGAGTPQTIAFSQPADQILGVPPIPVFAKATSGLPVSLVSSTTAVCNVAGGLIALLSAGTCTITATQGGNAQYGAAPPLARSFKVSAARPSGTLAPAPGSPIALGANPYSLAVADFNGDGIADLVTANGAANNLTVLLGNGSGGFSLAPGSPFPAGMGPISLTVADFDGDGFSDLAVGDTLMAGGSGLGGGVTILLGNGLGGFNPVPGSPFSAGANAIPQSLAAGDFNLDGIPDLAIADHGNNAVIVLLGNGSGSFAPSGAGPFPLGASPAGPVSILMGDFNGDNIQDLITANQTAATLSVLLGDGTGGFTAAPGGVVRVGTQPLSMAVGDFNGDGIEDVVTTSTAGNSITVLLGNGTGGFSAAPGSPLTLASPWSVAVGDLDGDGNQDLAVSTVGNGVTVLLGNGAGGFTAVAGTPFAAATNPIAIIAADLNGDGMVDIAAANYGTNSVTALLGGLAPTSSVLTTTATSPAGFGKTVNLTATVANSGAAFAAPTGSIAIMDGAKGLGTGQLPGPYTLATSNLAGGQNSLTAAYSGDARNMSSTSSPLNLQVTGAPAAMITTLSPTSAIAGSPGFTLTINGTGFVQGAQVQWNTSMVAAAYVSATQLTAMVPASLIMTAGAATIVVTNPGSTASNTAQFTVAPVTVTSLSPATATAGGPPLTLTIIGTGFVQGAQVQWNASTLMATYVSATKLTVMVPAAQIATAGTVTVSVTNPGASASNTAQFTIVALTITSLKPASANAGGAAFTLCANGTGFNSGSALEWNGAELAMPVYATGQFCASVSASQIAAPGKISITIVNTDGAQSPPATFTVIAPPPIPPTITQGGIVPLYNSRPIIQPGSWVSIYGTNLASSDVVWNGDFPTSLDGVSVTIDNKAAYLWSAGPTQINLQAPDDATTGKVNVVVTSPTGTAKSTVTLAAYAPSLSLMPGSNYAAGVILTPNGTGAWGNGIYDLLGPAGYFSFKTRPVKAGEIVELFGVGFGPTKTPVVAGKAFSGAAPTSSPVTITIGGVKANVLFAGLVAAGLYQINVVVPAGIAAGDKAVVATVNANQTQAGVYVTVQ